MEEKDKEYPVYAKKGYNIFGFEYQAFYKMTESGYVFVRLSKEGALIETGKDASEVEIKREPSSEEEFNEAFEIAVKTINTLNK